VSKILVADDNSNIQKMVALALKDLGIEVTAVGNGEAAVRKLPEFMPDLILADIFMPVRSGYEVCEFVKKDERFAHIPVILLIGTFDPFDEKEAQRVGADGVLKKPFVPPDPLIALVQSTLEKFARAQAAPAPIRAPAPVRKELAPPVAVAAPQVIPVVAAEPETEEFNVKPSPVVFQEEERPEAFGELLEMPATSLSPEPEPGPSDTDTEWSGASPAEPDEITSLASVEAASETEAQGKDAGFGFRDFREPPAEPEPEPWHPGPIPTLTEAAESAARAGGGFNAAPWMESASNFPSGTLPEQSAGPTAAAPAAAPDSAATAAGTIAFPHKGEHDAEPSFPAGGGTPAAEPEPTRAPRAYAESEPAPKPPINWPAVAAETPSSELAIPSPKPEPPAAPAQAAEPASLEAMVEKVMAQLQPQILDLISKSVVRPVVEAVIQREREKK
jgi:CheY-like chemotaxis protein